MFFDIMGWIGMVLVLLAYGLLSTNKIKNDVTYQLLNLLAENKIEKGTRIKYNETIYIVDFPNLCGIYPEEICFR